LLFCTVGEDAPFPEDAICFADLGPDRHPDGLCVDLEGGVWVGCYDTGEFVRVLAGGVVTHRVAIETGWAIATPLGGSDGCTLYMMVDDTSVEVSAEASRRGGS